jgi:hypothetical protein
MQKIKYIEAKKYYDSFKWKKATYSNYLMRIKKNLAYEIAVQPWFLDKSYRKKSLKNNKPNKKDLLLEFYQSYSSDKVSLSSFLYRVNKWLKPEFAIRMSYNIKKDKRERNRLRNIKKSKFKTIKQSYYLIEVTYDKETAKIFRWVYEDMISKLNDELLNVEKQTEASYIIKKIKSLEYELSVFNKWNK